MSTDSINPGEVLRTSRERLGLSINDVSVATKINPRILRALEDGNKSELPPSSFSRGFIRSYSAYLKIEAQPILDAFNLNDGTAPNPVINTDPQAVRDDSPPNEKTRRTPSMPESSVGSKALLVGGLLVIAGIIFGVKKVVDKYAQERVVEPISVDENANPTNDVVAEPTTTTTQESRDTKATEEQKALTPPEENAAAAVEAKKDDTKGSETQSADTKPAENKVADAKPTESKTVENIPTPTPSAPASTPQEVIIEALDSVEVSIVIDGAPAKKIKLTPESVHTIKAKSSIQLDIKDGGMVNIIHNGHERGIPGDLGKPAKLKFP